MGMGVRGGKGLSILCSKGDFPEKRLDWMDEEEERERMFKWRGKSIGNGRDEREGMKVGGCTLWRHKWEKEK